MKAWFSLIYTLGGIIRIFWIFCRENKSKKNKNALRFEWGGEGEDSRLCARASGILAFPPPLDNSPIAELKKKIMRHFADWYFRATWRLHVHRWPLYLVYQGARRIMSSRYLDPLIPPPPFLYTRSAYYVQWKSVLYPLCEYMLDL